MNSKVVKTISYLIKFPSFVAQLAAFSGFIPPQYGAIATIAFMGASTFKDFLLRAGDIADDGKVNNSFKG